MPALKKFRHDLLALLMVGVTLASGATISLINQPALHAKSLAQHSSTSANAEGTIAYLAANSTQIRLIDADGTHDRLLWQVPNPDLHKLSDVDWSPDGTKLAFASDHESTCSLFRSDIYSINADGSNLRRLTNSPACAGLTAFPKGNVQVTIDNQLTESLYLLYVEGAANAVEIPISPATRRTVTVDNVADFGDGVLQRVVIFQTEEKSWQVPSVTVDVIPNTTTAASDDFIIKNSTKATFYGAYSPSWRRDSQAVAFAFSRVGGYLIPANPSTAQPETALFPAASIFGRAVAMSPVDDQVLLFNDPFIGVGTVGDAASVQSVLEFSGGFYGMDWMSDGSGFVAGEVQGLGNTHANIFAYRFGASEIEPLTSFESEYAADPSFSPDGTQIVYIYAETASGDAQIQIMDRDGANVRSLGVNGLKPDWGIPSETTPTPTATPSPTATNVPGQTATPTPVPSGTQRNVYLPAVQR